MLGRRGLGAFGCRAIAAVIAAASVVQGCSCGSSSGGCGGCSGCDPYSGCSYGSTGCTPAAVTPCYGPYCDGGPHDSGLVHHDAGFDGGPSVLCAPGLCNVLTSVGCPASLACRLPIAGMDAGAVDAGAVDAMMDGELDASDVDAGDDGGALDASDAGAPDLGEPFGDGGPPSATLVCEPFGTGRSGSPCAADVDCAAGFMCLPTVGGAHCRAYCCGGGGCPFAEECRYELTSGIQLCAAFDECDPVAQTGCLPGWECNVWDDHSTGCDAIGALGAGATCASRLDCGPGLACGPMLASICRRYCNPSDPASCGGGYCSRLGPGDGLCYPSAAGPCDPLRQLGCPDGTSCYPDALDHVQCVPSGTFPLGALCASLADCVGGAVCTDVAGVLRCAPLCDVASGAPCGGATHCAPTSGYPAGVGACM